MIDFRREYLVRLPLPLAQLYSRAFNAKEGRARHDNAFYLFEVLIKLSAAPLIAEYVEEIQRGQPRVASLDRLLLQLALPSLGQWAAIVRELSRYFSQRPDALEHPLGQLWKRLCDKRQNQSGLLALHRRIKHGVDGQPAGDQSCSVLEVLEALVQYRNSVFGHGGPRFESFFEKEMGPLLLPAVNDLLEEGSYEFLGRRGSRLIYITDLRTIDEDRVEVGRRELVGLAAERMAPLVLTKAQADGLLPNRVAVLWPGRVVPLRLDPLLLYRESETAEEVLFLNRDRNQREVEYLSYASGRTERDKATAPELCKLLSVVARRDIGEADLKRLSEQSMAETPSVEVLGSLPEISGQRQGDYELLAEIGRGGMGVVFLARQLSLGRIVALKMLPTDLAEDEVALLRFRREIQHLARCEHPNIVKVLASGTMPDGRLYYTMEYVPGCDLEQVWKELGGEGESGYSTSKLGQSTWAKAVLSASRKRREETSRKGKKPPESTSEPQPVPSLPLPPLPDLPSTSDDPGGYIRRVCELIRDVANAVQAVHDQKIIHRDVKPANIMLTPDGSRAVLMDFGLAKGESLALTASRQAGFLGTLRYAAPEQMAATTIKVGPSADVRGLGCVMWEMVTGKRLFGDCRDEAALATRVLQSDVPRLRAIDPAFDRDLEAIVARTTERRIEDRVVSATQFAQYLQLYLDAKPIPIRPASSRELFVRWCRRNVLAASSLAAVAVLLMISAVGGTTLAVVATRNASRADRNADVAAEETNTARRERDRAESVLSQYKWGLYAWQIGAAQREWGANNVAGGWANLDACDPALRGWEYDYLYTLFTKNQRTLNGHSKEACAVAFSPDGKRIVSGSNDSTIKIWDVVGGKELLTLKGHASRVMSVAFSPDGKRIVSGSLDTTARLWDAADCRQLLILKGHADCVTSVSFSPDGKRLVSASRDKTLKLWDAASGRELLTFKGHAAPVSCVAFSPDGQQIVSGSFDATLKIWDTVNGQVVRTLKGHAEGVTSVAFSPNGRRIASASFDRTAKVWDASTGDEKLTLRGHAALLWSVSFSPDGRRVASGCWDKTIKVWDAVGGQEIFTLRGHVAPVQSVAFSPDGKWLASASDDHTVKLWQAIDGQEPLTRKGHTSEVTCVAISTDGRRIVSGSWDKKLKVWDAASGQETLTLKGHDDGVMSAAFSPDGRRIVSGGAVNTIKLWDADTGRELLTFQGHAGRVTGVAFIPDGKRIVSAGSDGTLRIWDTTGRELRTLRGHAEAVTSVAVSPDGNTIISGSGDKTLKVWDLPTGREKRTLSGHTDEVLSVAVSPEGKHILSGSWDKTLKVWDATSGRELRTLTGHTREIFSVAFSPDGKRAASGSGDYTFKVWNVDSGQETLTLRHSASVYSVVFSPDGKRIVSGSGDNTIKVWDASTSGKLPYDQLGTEHPW